MNSELEAGVMEQTKVKIQLVENITHDVLRIVTEKPGHIIFMPGQAVELSINTDAWKDEKRCFTFTGLPHYDYLEFTIKTYPDRKSVTNQLLSLKKNDEIILHEVFGTIGYKNEGVFIAGGAGVTPFISIFRQLEMENKIGNNKLIFANKTKADIIYEQMFSSLLGDNFINILSDERRDEYAYGHITEEFLRANINDHDKQIYLCGPEPMMDVIEKQLINLGGEKLITKEEF